MPALVASYQNQALKTQLKKMLSVISQNIQSTAALSYDNSSIDCSYLGNGSTKATGCSDFWGNFVKSLNVIKTCNENALSSGCIADGYSVTPLANCGYWTTDRISTKYNAYIFNDGSMIMPAMGSNTGLPASQLGVQFLIDTNGLKGPNKAGYDIFTLRFVENISGGYIIHPSLNNCITLPADAPFRSMEDVIN
jgi:hypothetical protein